MTKRFPHFLLLFILTAALLLPACFCQAQDDTIYTTTDTVASYNEDDYTPSTEDNEDEEDEEDETDAEILPVVRTMSADSIDVIKRSSEFFYMTYLDSLLRARQKEKDNMPEPEEDDGLSLWDTGIVKLICWLVAIGLVGFVLYKLFLGGGVFFSNKKQELPAVQLEDTPDESNLEKALQQAIKKEDYRMATRYLFLITISRLGEKGALQLSTEKTNYQYAAELAGKPYANQFAKLSLQYEYVWFGGFTINQTQFTSLQQQHQQFLKQI